jgi:hypothetical protein
MRTKASQGRPSRARIALENRAAGIGVVRLLTAVAGQTTLLAGPAHAQAVAPRAAIAEVPGERPPAPQSRVGVSADVGLPDGFIASIVARPLRWLRLAAGAGSNGAALGFRGGLTLVPLGAGPSLSLEVGHSQAGALGSAFALAYPDLDRSLFERVSYSYANAQPGLELGRGRVAFYLRGGLSYVRATLGGSGAAIEQQVAARAAQTGASTLVSVPGDLGISAVGLAGKLGMLVYLD